MSQCRQNYSTDETLKSPPNLKVVANSDENTTETETEALSQIETIRKLRLRLEKLYTCIANDQMLHIYNLENIKLPSVTHNIKHKIECLFFEAGVPQTWKIDIKWSTTPVLVVHVRMLNYLVKEKTKELLLSYLSTDYHNNYLY